MKRRDILRSLLALPFLTIAPSTRWTIQMYASTAFMVPPPGKRLVLINLNH